MVFPYRFSYFKFLLCVMMSVTFISCNNNDDDATPLVQKEEPEITEVPDEDKLPHFLITTNGIPIADEPKIDAEMIISEKGSVVHNAMIGIEIRGSSSQMFPKKSYGFETRDAENNDIDISLLGLPEEEDWILYAPYSDKSLVRNILIYDLSRDMNRYASRSQLVEVSINGDYRGVYVFMEKLKRDKERIDINTLKDDENSGENLTGGYILKIDKGFDEQNSFISQWGSSIGSESLEIRFIYTYPKSTKITPEQKEYITTYINDFETVLASDGFMDPVSGYSAFIDVDSFVDFFILNELSNNVDGYRISTYMHKDKNEKLKMGPIWDFNLAFGNADYCSGGEPNVWAYKFNERCPEDSLSVPFWWGRLLEDPNFVALLKERWSSLRGSTLSTANVRAKVDGYIDVLDKSGALKTNFETWNILGTYVWPNNYIGRTYTEDTDYLKGWISNRMVWMDGAINAL